MMLEQNDNDAPSKLEKMLVAYAPGVWREQYGMGNPGHGEVSDADRELMVAYLERRLTAFEEQRFRARLAAEPCLQAEIAEFLAAARDTEYGEALFAEKPASAGERRGWALWTILPRPVYSLPLAAAAALVLFVVAWQAGILNNGGGAGINQQIAALAQLRQQGQIDQAWQGYLELANNDRLSSPQRATVSGQLEEVTEIAWRQRMQQRQFDGAARIVEEALALLDEPAALLACAGDARLMALRTKQGRDFALGYQPAPKAKSIAYEDPAEERELSRILDYYLKAAQKDPANARAWIGQGEIYLERGQREPAGRAVEQARRAAPDDPATYNILGRWLQAEGRRDQAEAAYQKALELDAQYQPARYNLDALFDGGAKNAPSDGAPPDGNALDRLFEQNE